MRWYLWAVVGTFICASCGDLFPFNGDPPQPGPPWQGPHLVNDVLDATLVPDTEVSDWVVPNDVQSEQIETDLADAVEQDSGKPDDAGPDQDAPDLPTCPCVEDDQCPATGEEPCVTSICVVQPDGCGQCEEQTTVCDDGNPCTVDMCSPETDGCLFLAADVPCDDGNPCTLDDHCVASACAPGAAVKCDDGDPCTDDYCHQEVGCTASPLPGCCNEDADCDDLNLCTTDECNNFSCYHKLLFCDDADVCTKDLCDPKSGCYTQPVTDCCNLDDQCNDSDLCTKDWCLGNACHHSAVSCDDGDLCTKDSCQPQSGCLHQPIPGCCHTVADCNDQNLCTVDSCQFNACVYSPASCNDQNICTADQCQPATGCQFAPIAGCCLTTADCNDNSLCTTDQCSNNKCQHADVDCTDGDACTTDQCLPAKGCQFIPVPDPGCCNSDPECNDLDPCTSDACIANSCLHTPIGGPGCCTVDCAGKQCGPDGCGGTCGSCPEGFFCKEDEQKCYEACNPKCAGKECGPDGCGTYCGHCEDNEKCNLLGQCVVCQPFCWGKQCGSDGCGGSCGICEPGFSCVSDIGQCKAGCACDGVNCYSEGFEHGTLKDWSFEGDAEVTHNMGTTEAPEGFWMAVVGNGLSELEVGWLKKTFCPAADTTLLTLKWKFYSEEFKEWCGSEFQDSLVILLQKEGQSIEVLNVTIDDLCPPQDCPGCGSHWVGLQKDAVNFDQGDVWATPWQDLSFAVPAGFAADPFTLAITVTDVGDMIYTSAVLIDDIRFQ